MIVAGATHSYMEKQDYKLLKLKSHYCQEKENNYIFHFLWSTSIIRAI